MLTRYSAGSDIGAITAKAAILSDDQELVASVVVPAGYNRLAAAEQVLAMALERAGLERSDLARVAATGYGRVQVPDVDRMVTEIAESAAVHRTPARAKGAAARIKRLFAAGDLAGCLRTVRRLAHQTADEWHSPMADSALSVIDALARSLGEGPHPREEAVLLAIYALLQIVREPEDQHGPGDRAADD